MEFIIISTKLKTKYNYYNIIYKYRNGISIIINTKNGIVIKF
jgi:hypothetical protein